MHAEELDFELGPQTEIWDPWDATAWRWWRLELGASTTATLVDGIPLASAAGHALHAYGQDYITNVQVADGGSTTLLVAGDDGELRAGLEIPGCPMGSCACAERDTAACVSLAAPIARLPAGHSKLVDKLR